MLAAGKAEQLALAAPGGVGRRAPARGDLAGVPRRHRGRDHRRHRLDRDAAHLHLGRRRRHPARRDRRPVPGYRGDGARRRRQRRCRPASAGRLAVKGPTGCRYLADDRQAAYVQRRLEHHRRHLRPGRRRLLLVPGPQRRHDHLLRLQHRRPGGRGGAAGAPGRGRVRRRRRAGRGARAARQGVRRARDARTAGADELEPQLQDFVKAADRAVQVPARGRVRRPSCRAPPPASCSASGCASAGRDARRERGARDADRGRRRRPRRAVLRRAGQAARTRSTRSPSGSATRPTTRSASASCSPTRRSAASSTPTRRSTRRWSASSPAGTTSTCTTGARCITSGGHGFAAMSRRRLLEILQQRCAELGVDAALPHRRRRTSSELAATTTWWSPPTALNSAVRAAVRRRVPARRSRCGAASTCGSAPTWSSTRSSSTSSETPHGVMQIHGYPYDATGSTFIVEMHDEVWRARRVRRACADRRCAPGESDEASIERDPRAVRRRARRPRGARQQLASGSASARVRSERWRHGNVVLLGDAAHTAHFSIGSGTKLAMEDALALAACLHEQPDGRRRRWPPTRPSAGRWCASTQRAAQASLEWFENLGQYVDQEPDAVRVQHHDPQPPGHLRQPAAARPGVRRPRSTRWFAGHEQRRGHGTGEVRPPMFQPFRLRGLELANRVVVSPMDMYSAADGVPGDFHLVHLGGKALGGAGLVMTEMVCVSPDGPDHARAAPGMYDRRAERGAGGGSPTFVHAAVGGQDRPPARPLRPQGLDEADVGGHRRAAAPTATGRSCGPSPLPYLPGVSQVPARADRGRAGRRSRERVRRPRAGAASEAGFDLLELHCAHGYLLSSFISPLTNQRTDDYGGVAGRAAALPARGVRRDARGVAGRQADDACGSRRPTGSTAASPATDAVADRAGVRGRGRGRDRRVHRAGDARTSSRPSAARYQTPFADAIRNQAGHRRPSRSA